MGSAGFIAGCGVTYVAATTHNRFRFASQPNKETSFCMSNRDFAYIDGHNSPGPTRSGTR